MTCLKICFFLTLVFIAVFGVPTFGQTVKGSIANGTVKRGTTARGTIVLEIPHGLHVNSNRPSSEYLIPTVVRLTGKNVKPTTVTYPRGADRIFKFSSKSLNVYEGTIFFPFKVAVPRTYKGKTISLTARVEFQACTEDVCYPPNSETVTFTARVK